METIQYLLNKIFKMIIILIIMWFVIWVVSILYPSFTLKNFLAIGGNKPNSVDSWLPSPGSFGGLFSAFKNPNVNNMGNTNSSGVYTVNPTYSVNTAYYVDTNGNNKIINTGNNSTQVVVPDLKTNNQYSQKSLYIRNLSIYEGGHIYTGISFTGEARSTMFQNGKFPIVIIDNTGKVASVATAEATSNWATAGWTRFQTKINTVLPNKVSCTMVFQSANNTSSTQPVRVAIPILCN